MVDGHGSPRTWRATGVPTGRAWSAEHLKESPWSKEPSARGDAEESGGKQRRARELRGGCSSVRRVSDADRDRYRTYTQKEWADWSGGYRKLYQPRSMLWFGGIFVAPFGAGLATLFWLAASGRLP
jgi:hypothetical protein